MFPAFPPSTEPRKESPRQKQLVLEISDWLGPWPAVSVPTFKTISPAGAAPPVSAPMCVSSARASVCAVIVMAPGVVAALPPKISVRIWPLSRRTSAAGLPEPVTP